jgi:TrmH family RNA methyltransferase
VIKWVQNAIFASMKSITSPQNSFIKDLLKLQDKARERKKKGVFIVEGQRELKLALAGSYEITHLLFDPSLCDTSTLTSFDTDTNKYVEISREVYKKLAYRESTEGIIAVLKSKDFSLDAVKFNTETPLVLVMESIEKPGNVGAMLRTADAANVDAVFIADPKADLYNPNIIRSSVGCLFTNQIAIGSSEEICEYLEAQQINIYSATLQNSNAYHLNDYTQPSALVVGTEATGLTEIWRERATQNINIPMQGTIDSMNVSVAAAILTFEAKRQRDFQ